MTGRKGRDMPTVASPATQPTPSSDRVRASLNTKETSMPTASDTTSHAQAPDTPSGTEVVTGPSRVVRLTIKPMSKVLNPLVKKVAGRKYLGMAAQVHHRGRRSGRGYTTTAGARVHDGVIWIPLTFGTGSDWCRNVLAAGECGVRWKATDYTGTDPVVLDRRAAMSAAKKAFKLPERGVMHVMGIKHFIRLDVRS
jgi:deazaflavin-dependent oxidoreductase (nitroreductase family)